MSAAVCVRTVPGPGVHSVVVTTAQHIRSDWCGRSNDDVVGCVCGVNGIIASIEKRTPSATVSEIAVGRGVWVCAVGGTHASSGATSQPAPVWNVNTRTGQCPVGTLPASLAR
jgi:hypothetical protein